MVKKVPRSVANYQIELIWDENGASGGEGEYDGMKHEDSIDEESWDEG